MGLISNLSNELSNRKESDKGDRKSDTKYVRYIADTICIKLNAMGFHVLRYDAPFSSYIKIDGGLCHSIRVSNHKSPKEHLRYRYNILLDCLDSDYVTKDSNGYVKYYARGESTHKIIDMIDNSKNTQLKKYGELNYYTYVLENINKNKWHTTMFWSKAKTVVSTNAKAKNKIEYKDKVCSNRIYKKVSKLKRKYGVK